MPFVLASGRKGPRRPAQVSLSPIQKWGRVVFALACFFVAWTLKGIRAN